MGRRTRLSPEQVRQRDAERGRHAAAARRERLEHAVDPDGTLSDEERQRRIRDIYAERSRRAARSRKMRPAATKSGKSGPRQQAKPDLPSSRPAAPPPSAGPLSTSPTSDLPPKPDPQVWDGDEMRTALAARDIGTVYRLLGEAGVSQRRLARLTGQAQSEVSEIVKGRVVSSYEVLSRIADGLGIPRERMGLSSYPPPPADTTYPEGAAITDPEGDEDVLRRHFERLLAVSAAAVFGTGVRGIGELAEWLATRAPRPPGAPGRIGSADVRMIRQCGELLSALARTCGGRGLAAVRLAGWGDEWLDAEYSEGVRRELLSTVADLHTLAGWCSHDSGAPVRAHWHFERAIELATSGRDAYQAAHAMRNAGLMLVDRGQPNRALKQAQLATLRLSGLPGGHDPRVPVILAECRALTAIGLARLDPGSRQRVALDELTAARGGWSPPTEHARGCMDLDSAHAHLFLGLLDGAEALATAAASALAKSGDRREGVLAELAVARVHVLAGEPRGLVLADQALREIAATDSAVARLWLPPLAAALDARPGSDAKDLTRRARQVASGS